MKLQIITMPSLGSGVTGKRTEPSRPYDFRSGDRRWLERTDLPTKFEDVRAELRAQR